MGVLLPRKSLKVAGSAGIVCWSPFRGSPLGGLLSKVFHSCGLSLDFDPFRSVVLLLAPFAPHLVAELWEELGEEGSVLRAPWPASDRELAKDDELEVPVQINGKLVTVVRVAADAQAKTIEAAALREEKIQARIAGKTVVKVILVPRKLVNLVVK